MNCLSLTDRWLVVLLSVSILAFSSCSGEEPTATPKGTEPTESTTTPTREARCGPLQGNIGRSARWGSGWLDLSKKIDFHRGDTLKLNIGGTAKNLVVRLLAEGMDPNTPSRIDGGIVEVPESRLVEKVLQQDHKNVVQISVHGGTNPWDLFPLGGGNGPAYLLSAECISRNAGNRIPLASVGDFSWVSSLLRSLVGR